ncbi:MAG: MarR family winged helix-turn-helix transcriptional regulator [Marmoricola sp.]
MSAQDAADRHVEHWRDHWLDIPFDPAIEAATVRVGQIAQSFKEALAAASAEVGIQVHEYETLHALMIRDTPGHATPTELAEDTHVSPAGITGRLDSMERAGWVRRVPSLADRRRIDVEITREGLALWRRAMDSRGSAETDLFSVLTQRDLATLNRLLKKLTLTLEA